MKHLQRLRPVFLFLITAGAVVFSALLFIFVVPQARASILPPVFLKQIITPSAGGGIAYFSSDGPTYIAFSTTSEMYVANEEGYITKFDSSGVLVATHWESGDTGDNELDGIPEGIAIDSTTGSVYVADTQDQRIEKFNSSGAYVTQWGSSGASTGQFSQPNGVAVDSSGNVYVADTLNNRVQKFDSNGNYISTIGSNGTGAGQIKSPRGIAIDASNNLYVNDSTNRRVSEFNSSGAFVRAFGWGVLTGASSPEVCTATCVAGKAGSGTGEFLTMVGIAVDSSDDTFVMDAGARHVIEYGPTGAYVTQWGSLGSGDGQFINLNLQAQGIAIKPSTGDIYAVDSGDARVERFSSTGSFLGQWSSAGTGNGQFNGMNGIAVATSTNIYVVDSGNNRIEELTATGTYVTQWGTTGSGNGQFNFPLYDAIDSNGNVYVTDYSNNRVQKFDSNGNYITQWGSHGTGNSQFNGGQGIAIDSSNNVYVTDYGNDRVEKFDSNGNYITQWGSLGSTNGLFNGPLGIKIDSSNNVFVADTNNFRIEEFSSAGAYISKFGTNGSGDGQFTGMKDIALDPLGNIYASDAGPRIEKFDSSGNYVTQFGSVGALDGEFDGISAIAFSLSGGHYLYVADNPNNRVSAYFDDTSPPSVAITSPTGGATVSGTVAIAVAASDDITPPTVSLYLDGSFFGTATTTSPYSFYWNTASTTLGSHTLLAVARDMVNTATSSPITVTVGLAPVPPGVSSPTFSSIASTTVTFSATITNAGNASSTAFGFNYGTTTSYGTATTTTGSLGFGDSFSANISGLSCATLYHVQGFATNTGGTGTSTDSTFTTSGAGCTYPPTIGNVSSFNTSNTSTDLTAFVTSSGGVTPTMSGFNYGLTTSYGTTIASSTGSFIGVFNQSATGLTCNTTYHFQAYATNSKGTGYSPDNTFTTASCSSGTGRTDYFGYSDVLLVENDTSTTSIAVANYFAAARGIDPNYIVHLNIPGTTDPVAIGDDETPSPADYLTYIQNPIRDFMISHNLLGKINYILLSKDIPRQMGDSSGSVDNTLAACLQGPLCSNAISYYAYPQYLSIGLSALRNPFYNSNTPFSSSQQGIYEVTRLDGYTLAGIESMIDRSANATTTSNGTYEFDTYCNDAISCPSSNFNNAYMVAAGNYLANRGFNVLLDETTNFIRGVNNVAGYYSWGSNDAQGLPFNGIPNNTFTNGSIGDTFVSSSGRSFDYPPQYGQSLIADLLAEGMTGAQGYVGEPYTIAMAHADILFAHYNTGYNLADSYYSADQVIKWQNLIVGDPKMEIMHQFVPTSIVTPFNFFTATSTLGMTFSWNRSSILSGAAIEYRLYIDGTPYATHLMYPSYTLPVNLGIGTHTWNVRSYSGGLLLGSTTPATLYVTAPPNTFDLIGPSNNSSTGSTEPTFSWSAFTSTNGGVTYTLYIDGNAYQRSIAGTSLTLNSPLSYGSHTWFVRAVDGAGVSKDSTSIYNINITNPDNTALATTNLLISNISTSSVSFSWTTNRAATTKVNFGPSSSYGSSTPTTDTSVLVTSHSVSLTGLVPCTQYHYQSYSVDNGSVVGTSPDHSFLTTGCTGSANVIGVMNGTITTVSGGSLSFTDTYQHTANVSAPASFTGTSTSATFQIKQIDPIAFFLSASLPVGQDKVGNSVYNIQAVTSDSENISSFNQPISVTVSYDPSDIGDLNEDTLQIYRYDDPTWTALTGCSTDKTAHTVTCSTTGFSDFVLTGNSDPTPDTTATSLTPTPSPTPSTPAASSGGGGPIGLISSSGVPSVKGTTVTTATASFTIGEQDASVLALQKALAAGGFLQAKYETGYYGTLTQAALTAYLKSGATSSNNSNSANASSAVFAIKNDLSIGMTSASVKVLQEFLNAQGYTIAVTGAGSLGHESSYFGALTKKALAKYQKAHGVSATGYFGPLTRVSLSAAL